MFIKYFWWIYMISAVDNAVLDPALHLSPSPPLKDTSKHGTETELWLATADKKVEYITNKPAVLVIDKKSSEEDTETMEKSETFWPFVRSPEIRVAGVHIPLTFSVSGTYDRLKSATGVISTSYLKIPGSTGIFESYGKSGLAGSAYGKYPVGYPSVKVYASSNEPAWGGWGNGKWGNYGKG